MIEHHTKADRLKTSDRRAAGLMFGAVLVAFLGVMWSARQAIEGSVRPSVERTRLTQSATTDTELPLDARAILGNPASKVILLEFADMECPFCKRFDLDLWPLVKAEYVDSGRVAFAFRPYPLTDIHSNALVAASYLECALQRDQFWPMKSMMFQKAGRLTETALVDVTKQLGVDDQQFRTCVASTGREAVRRVVDESTSLQITGTPTFFLGLLESTTRVHVVDRLVGVQDISLFRDKLERLLQSTTR